MKLSIATLTHEGKLPFLKETVSSFLENCSYRPLTWAIFNNGAEDGTDEYLKSLPNIDGITWEIGRSDINLGCGAGVNKVNSMVKDFEYVLFLEADWIHLKPEISGNNKDWLDKQIEFMDNNQDCNYILLRRFQHEMDARMHLFGLLLSKSRWHSPSHLITREFYSNNPHLRRNKYLYDLGTLPMPEYYDKDGNPTELKSNRDVWGAAEWKVKRIPECHILVWGMFVHEHVYSGNAMGCGQFGPYGISTCKYGFLKSCRSHNIWCEVCDKPKDALLFSEHDMRFMKAL